MSDHIHFIVARCRSGWAVNVEADLLSEHGDLREALAEAEMLSAQARAEGCAASVIDLSGDAEQRG